MAYRKKNVSDLDDDVLELNDKKVKKLGSEITELKPSLKLAMRMNNQKVKIAESLDVGSLETRLEIIAKEKKKALIENEKLEKEERLSVFGKEKKKKKKERVKNLRMMFSAPESDVEEVDEEGNQISGFRRKETPKNELIKDTDGTILDSTLGKRFAPLYVQQMKDYEVINKIAEEIFEDLKTSPSKNMYRSSQTSNLLTALSQKRTLLKDMTDLAKTVSDIEFKYMKEEKSSKNDDEKDSTKLASKIGVSLISGLYDDVFESDSKKKKKKKNRFDDDDDEDEDEYTDDKKSVTERLAQRVAKSVQFSDYERNLDIEGEFKLAVLADKDEPEKDWKFILVDNDGERRKDWEKERPELIPKKSEVKVKFLVDKLKVVFNQRKYDLYLK